MGFSHGEDDLFEHIEQAIMQIGWLGQRQFMQLLADERFDLTVPQFHTLLHLSYCDGECKMSDLARSTHQSAASLTGVVDRLLEKRLVARGRSDGDRRQVFVSLTDKGHEALQERKAAWERLWSEHLAGHSADELQASARVLHSIATMLDDIGRDSPR